MKYLKLYEEKVDNVLGKKLMDLKSLPYKDFMSSLNSLIADENVSKQLQVAFEPTDVIKGFGNTTEEYIEVSKLIPTQTELGLKESISWMSTPNSIDSVIIADKAPMFDKNKILVLNKKWILEGQHRWAFVYLLNPSCKIPCININMPEQGPLGACKDIQIASAAMYGKFYQTTSKIDYNLSTMDEKSITETLERIIPNDYMILLQQAYAQTSLIRQIAKQVLPQNITESKELKSLDYQQLLDEKPDDTDIKDLDQKDPDDLGQEEIEKDGALEKIQDGMSVAGWVDPSGAIDILNGAIYIYSGNYLMGFLSIMSAVPLADVACKGLMAIFKSYAMRKFTQLFGKALRKFDAKLGAQIIAKMCQKFPKQAKNIEKYLKIIVDGIQVVSEKIGKFSEWISSHWIKFAIVKNLFLTKIVTFFKDLLNNWMSIKDLLNKVPEDSVYETISQNAIAIKDLIDRKKISTLGITRTLAPNIVLTAMSGGFDPKSKDFKGIPKDFLQFLPSVAGSLQTLQKRTMKKFSQFEPEVADEESKVSSERVKKTSTEDQSTQRPITKKVQTKNSSKEEQVKKTVVPKVKEPKLTK